MNPLDTAKQKKRSGRATYLLCLLSVLLICAPLFRLEYATDTYSIISVGFGAFANSMFENGRLVTAIF